jgi:hypothetical protein
MTEPGPDWVEQARRFAAGLATDHPGLTDALGGLLGSSSSSTDHGGQCRSCPLCAALAAVRGRRPDLLEALADVLASASTALRSTAARPTPNDSAAAAGDSSTTAPPEETVPDPAPASVVQKIDVA